MPTPDIQVKSACGSRSLPLTWKIYTIEDGEKLQQMRDFMNSTYSRNLREYIEVSQRIFPPNEYDWSIWKESQEQFKYREKMGYADFFIPPRKSDL